MDMTDTLSSLLLTDLYQLTMLHGYFRQGMTQTAVFEFFARKLPEKRNFLLAAGQAQVLEFLEKARFSESELQWLRETGRFDDAFIDYLGEWRFTGDVDGLTEGTVCFPNEPMLRVTAPLPEAQLLESRIINIMHCQTLFASKAARCVLAAPDKLLVDFGFRRAHGAEAGLFAARASYLAGFAGSATVMAGMLYDVPIYGTVAHSFVQAHDNEVHAFEHYAEAQPDNVVLIIDTYDTETGAGTVTRLAPQLEARGITVKAVRLDSGDVAAHARKVRDILDAAGLGQIKIFTSGDLDEYRLAELIVGGAPIDGFGVGTRLDTSTDAPYLDCAYKLMEYASQPRRKQSEGKATWPGAKQVYRRYDDAGRLAGDTVTLIGDRAEGEPQLVPLMRRGRRVDPRSSLHELRANAADQLGRLAQPLRSLEPAEQPYPVEISPAVRELAREVDRYIEAHRR
jgi:nicotinate phosphoribosyltransferase